MAPKILIFSIAMGADYSYCVKSIATFALTFFGYIISVLASAVWELLSHKRKAFAKINLITINQVLSTSLFSALFLS